jgi:hypothetical protein
MESVLNKYPGNVATLLTIREEISSLCDLKIETKESMTDFSFLIRSAKGK